MKRPHFLALLAGLLSGLAVYAWADEPSDDGGILPPNLFPVCFNCTLSGQLVRDKTVYAQECVNEWGPDYPRRYYVGRCARYQCDYGYYYIFEGWTALPTYQCTNQIVNDPTTCPGGTCLYIPFISDPHMAVQIGSGSKASCDTNKDVPTGPLTSAYASELVKAAMAPNDKR